MSWQNVTECGGAPRDMGLAQGRANAAEIRRHLEQAGVARRGRRLAGLRAFASGGVLGQGMAREIVRHYPHLAERMTGIARGAGVSFEGLMELFTRGPEACENLHAPSAAAAAASRDEADAFAVGRSLSLPSDGRGAWVVRRSAPEHGFASIEVTLPWLASCVAGVNESGLAVAIAPPAPGSRMAPPSRDPSCQLLVQECLQRFEETSPALDWCLERPSAGTAGLVFADRSGEIARVTVTGQTRRVVPSSDGIAVAGLDDEGQAQLRKRCQEAGGLEPSLLQAALGSTAVIWLSCADAELQIHESGGPPTSFKTR